MNFRIADTFTDSLARLTGDEQKAVKTTAFDLQLNPENPGHSFHKLDRAKDKSFWSVRVGRDIRLIVHKTADSLLLCYVNHHDKAYEWAERRKLSTHPKTGAAQLVELRETVQQVLVPIYTHPQSAKKAIRKKLLFENVAEEKLLEFGVPPDWLADVRAATEDTLFALAEHLPVEASEALLELATGGKPRPQQPIPASANPFDHTDALRRFRVMADVEELSRALESPWEKWIVFLHPEQRQWVERDYAGPARVSGSAGTGKTIVALHRAAHLARANPDSRVLLTTFSETLAHALEEKLRRLLGNEPRLRERLDVQAVHAVGLRLFTAQIGQAKLATRKTIANLLRAAAEAVGGHKFKLLFLIAEWDQVVDAWQLTSWEAYRDVSRLGRKTRLPEAGRKILWSIFERVRAGLNAQGLITPSAMFTALAAKLTKSEQIPFEFAVVDEAQDVSIAQLRFLAALGGNRPNALFFAGDLGQRIEQQPFSWKAVGVDIRGRSRTLRVNYRTSHQIRTQAGRLLGPEVADVDGNAEIRSDTVSVFNGPPPAILKLKNEREEAKIVGAWLAERSKSGVAPHEIGIIVRSEAQLDRAIAALEESRLPYKILDDHVATTFGCVSIATMHLAKGLEFRAVAVLACDDEVVPLQERIDTIGDDADLKEVYDTERHLLYVACTRARDHLLVTGVEPGSEFVEDMKSKPNGVGNMA
jgi:mRNA-degrading endonuclease RelE of RelBE toxin-antitoxin system